MIEILSDVPNNIVAAKASPNVNKDDYKNILMPALDKLLLQQDKLNLVLVLPTGPENISSEAWANDVIIVLKNYTNWHRIAIVSDDDGVRNFADTFGQALPGEFKGFSLPKMGESKQWASSYN